MNETVYAMGTHWSRLSTGIRLNREDGQYKIIIVRKYRSVFISSSGSESESEDPKPIDADDNNNFDDAECIFSLICFLKTNVLRYQSKAYSAKSGLL
jgi:hypothetical protein